MVYTSRYSNPELRTGKYTAVRISLGTPRWNIGYNLDAEMPDLMPFGLLHKFDLYEDFERAYFARLDQKGVKRILSQLQRFEGMGKDVVLLCYEDIPELFDPTPDPTKPCQAPSKRSLETPPTTSPIEQLALF